MRKYNTLSGKEIWEAKKQKNMVASNAGHLLRLILQTTITQQLQEMYRYVTDAETSKWRILARIVGQLTSYIGVVDLSFQIGTFSI